MSTQVATNPQTPLGQAHPPLPGRAGVAWGLVASSALAMAFADGFLVMALRGVVGSISRTDGLFAAWVRESLLLLPVYVFAVLAAVALTQRNGKHATPVTLGWIAMAGAVSGVLWTAASAFYDYRLQTHEMLDMPAMQSSCVGACPERMQHAALVLQGRAVGFAAAVFLVGNLLVMFWVYALRGGVLMPTTPRVPRARAFERLGRFDDLRLVMVASLTGAALIHLAVVPEHLAEWPLAAGFFVLLAVAELGAAGLVVVRGSTVVLVTVGLLSLVTLALWTLSRTQGMPFGPEAGNAEAIGFADVAACLLEAVTLVACVQALRPPPERRPAAAPNAIALVLTALVAVTALGLGGSALPGVHAFGVAGHGEEEQDTSVPSARLPGSLVPPSQPGGFSR